MATLHYSVLTFRDSGLHSIGQTTTASWQQGKRCPGRGRNFCKIREKPNLLVNRTCCCCTTPILISSLIPFCSNNPYSEPDADNSPNNDTDWDWGGGKASPCGSPGPNVDPDHQNAALTKTVLTGEDNAISEWIFLIFPFLPFDFLTKRP